MRKNYIIETVDPSNINIEEFINFVVKFYDKNWLGCKDFMHMPSKEDVIENLKKHKIYIAKYNNEIVGISTLKHYDELTDWYPKNKCSNLTGLLTKRTNKEKGIKGVGVELYRKMMEDSINNKRDIVAEIDCRNEHSLKAFAKASKNLNLDSAIVGIYTYTDSNYNFNEVPTFMVKVVDKDELCNFKYISKIDYTLEATKYYISGREDKINEDLFCKFYLTKLLSYYSTGVDEDNNHTRYYDLKDDENNLYPIVFDNHIRICNSFHNVNIAEVNERKQEKVKVLKKKNNIEMGLNICVK